MSTTMTLLIAVILAVGAGAAAALLVLPAEDAAPESRDDRPLKDFDARLDALESSQARLQRSIDGLAIALGSRDAAPNTRGGLVPTGELPVATGDKDAETEAPAEKEVVDVAAAVKKILASEWEDRQAIWTKLRKAGLLDEAIALFEQRTQENPQDADFQADLGNAYIQKVNEVADMEKGEWAIKADAAFDKALEMDSNHWTARFSKAISLSFWPPVFGKQPDAIKNFEVLIGQQETRAPQPGYEQTYLMLGNLYKQQGNAEKAQAIFRKGLTIFPQNEQLLQASQP